MQFKFDAGQEFQVRAITAVADLLQGQTPIQVDWSFGAVFGPVANRLDIDDDRLLANLQAVQERGKLPRDTALQSLAETIDTPAGPTPIRFPNFSVEMETGTGKTYVYLRTALEL